MKWDNSKESKLIELLKEGKNYDEISILLNKTKKSIICKANKLGYKLSDFSTQSKTCINCLDDFNYSTRSKHDNERKFCSQSCSASFNNKLRKKKLFCINCNNEILNKGKKYCSQECNNAYNKKIITDKIEEGDVTLNFRQYKKYLIEKYGECCMECGWDKVNVHSGKIPIELEHIDGDSSNNNLNNLKLLCPNCHSLTPTYKGLNKGNGRYKRKERYKQGKSY